MRLARPDDVLRNESSGFVSVLGDMLEFASHNWIEWLETNPGDEHATFT